MISLCDYTFTHLNTSHWFNGVGKPQICIIIFKNDVLLEWSRPLCLDIGYGWFCAALTKSSSCDRISETHKA